MLAPKYLKLLSVVLISSLCMASECGPSCPDNAGNSIMIKVYEQDSMVYFPYYQITMVERNQVFTSPPPNLFLDVTGQKSTFLLDDGQVVDTLVFTYRSEPDYQDSGCGMQFKVTDLKVKSNRQTKLEVYDPLVQIWALNIYR